MHHMPNLPRLFIASSAEHLDTAYAAQEELEHDLEVTVWSQGVFELSKYTLETLEEVVRNTEFAMFVFAPDDLMHMRGNDHQVVRDNVIFELGLFLGALGRERCFILMPKGAPDLKLPSDLLGLTTAYYEPNRQDGNLRAALGPACNKVRSAAKAAAPIKHAQQGLDQAGTLALLDDDNDAISILQSWMGKRPSTDNTSAMRYAAIDAELGLMPGMARKNLKIAAERWGYRVAREGKETVLLAKSASSYSGY